MEQVDILVGEEAQQDMDLKYAFVPAIPRQPFLRLLFSDPKQSPGGVADNPKEHRALLLKAPIGLLAAHRICHTTCQRSYATSYIAAQRFLSTR